MEVFIQAVGLTGTVLFFLSFQFRRNKSLFRVQLVSYLCYTVHFLLLGAVTGGISYTINAIRSFCLGSQNRFLRGKQMCLILCMLQLLTLLVTWDSWWSVLPVAANIAATIGGYTYHPRKIRMATLLVNVPLWIVYDILVGSWAGVVDEIISSVSVIVSICRYGWNGLAGEDA